MLRRLPTPRLTSFSFGGGVQSTTIMALLQLSPEVFTEIGLTLPSVAIWSDTGAETFATLAHLDRLSSRGFPVPLVQVMADDHAMSPSGMACPPWRLRGVNGEEGIARRTCTDRWKIGPLEEKQRELAGYAPGERMAPGSIHNWVGISEDEINRAKDHPRKGFSNLYPLIYLGWDRNRCVEFLRDTFPWPVPKSSCFFCPYRKPAEWSRIRREEPEEWARAVAYDVSLRDADLKMTSVPYIHPALQPLPDAVDAWDAEQARRVATGGVPLFDSFDPLDNECSGLCGL